MEEWKRSNPPFWIRDKDDFGRSVNPDVLSAAERLWERVLYLAESKLNDLTRAAEVLEIAALAVSRTLRRRGREAVRDLDAYLYWACLRRFDRIAAKESRVQCGHEPGRLELIAANAVDCRLGEFYDELRLKELLSCMDSRTRRLFALRCQGYSWPETAEQMGYLNGHSAEVQFWKGVGAARRRLLPRSASKPPQSPKEAD
jgi:hypothetical protein